MVKPSEALKLILANPHTAKQLDRYMYIMHVSQRKTLYMSVSHKHSLSEGDLNNDIQVGLDFFQH